MANFKPHLRLCHRHLHRIFPFGSTSRALPTFLTPTIINHGVFSNRTFTAAAPREVLCHKLNQRSLLQISGADSTTFLQGLLTNDMRCLEGVEVKCRISSLYALMLNTQGRVLYDLILYKLSDEPEKPVYLVECNKDCSKEFTQMIKRYKIRKKVTITDMEEELSVWAALPRVHEAEGHEDPHVVISKDDHVVVSTVDPRLKSFGHRLVLPVGLKASSVIENAADASDDTFYDRRRYELGLGEGTTDLPPGQCFPLEANAVFTNGVSFSKGCYIGQELTARTHHTGVVRKRLMPVVFKGDASRVGTGDKVENVAGKNCGKLRGLLADRGLALLRVADVVGRGPLTVRGEEGEDLGHLSTFVPPWWPADQDEIVKQALASLG